MVNWEETDAGPWGRGGVRANRFTWSQESAGLHGDRDRPVTTSPHPSRYASPSDHGSLDPKAPGLGSQEMAFGQAELERVFSHWFVLGPHSYSQSIRILPEVDEGDHPFPLLRPDLCNSESSSGLVAGL